MRSATFLSRANLAEHTDAQLSGGGWSKARVTLARDGERRVVVKDFADGQSAARRLLGRWLLRRELRAYRALAGHPAVPRLLAELDPWAIVLEYRPGTLLSRSLRGQLPAEFVPRSEFPDNPRTFREYLHGNRVRVHAYDVAGGMPGGAAADFAPFQYNNIVAAKLCQLPGHGTADNAAADNDDLCLGGNTRFHAV